METLEIAEKTKAKEISITGLDSLISILIENNIPIDSWVSDSTKTVEHLFNEIEENETRLIVNEKGELERHIEVAIVEVLHIAKTAIVYGLREEKQVFNDGRVRERKLSTTIGENIKSYESPDDASHRALTEELGITSDGIDESMSFRTKTETQISDSYPGLTTYITTHPYMFMINEKFFNRDGYIEKQDDKTTYFSWDIVNG